MSSLNLSFNLSSLDMLEKNQSVANIHISKHHSGILFPPVFFMPHACPPLLPGAEQLASWPFLLLYLSQQAVVSSQQKELVRDGSSLFPYHVQLHCNEMTTISAVDVRDQSACSMINQVIHIAQIFQEWWLQHKLFQIILLFLEYKT